MKWSLPEICNFIAHVICRSMVRYTFTSICVFRLQSINVRFPRCAVLQMRRVESGPRDIEISYYIHNFDILLQ